MDLGPLVSNHPLDNQRRLTAALLMLGVAAAGLGIGVPWSIELLTRPYAAGESPSMRPSGFAAALTALGVIALLVAVPKLIKWAAAPGRPLALHRGGVVHGTEEIPFSAIASVRKQGFERGGLRHYLGFDFRCVLLLTDGRKIVFNTYTDDAESLAKALEAAVG